MTRPLTVARFWHPRLRDRIAGVTPATAAAPVTFPTTNLVTRVQIALGADLSEDPSTWNWLDITEWVRYDLGISLTTGRRDEATQVTTGSAQLKLDNRDGRFVRRNPTGPYYGLLSKNTPIWITIDAGSGEKTRVEMFVNEWPTRWSDQSANDSTVTIRCAGILRRLGQGRVLKSPLRRAVLASAPEAYWPLEDGADAIHAGASIEGPPLRVSGTVDFAAFADLAGAVQTPDMTLGSLFGSVSGVSATGWHAEFCIKMPFNGVSVVARVYSRSTEARVWRIFLPTAAGGSCQVYVTNEDGSSVIFSLIGNTVAADFENEWHHIAITAEQSGGNIVGKLYVDGVLDGASATSSGAGTLDEPFEFWANHQVTAVTSMAHIAVGSGTTPSLAAAALDAYSGEQAHVRILRLCAEEGVACTSLTALSVAMGPQGIDTLAALLLECSNADLGALYEKRWGLAYKAVSEFYNQAALMALDFATYDIAELPEPADDDQRTRNLWTVSRPDGSEATAEESTGPMGTGAQGPGVYDDATTVNVETDNQLGSQAGWRVHLGTIDEDRWPNIGLNFARRPALIDAFAALPFGARITAANPLSPYVDDLDLIVEGHSERWDQFLWLASLNCSPASAYRVFVVGSTSANIGRVDAANSTLAADATSVATSLSVASPAALWRTGAVTFDILVGGEQMTVTNIAGGGSPQTFTVVRSVNGVVKAQSAVVGGISTKVSLWSPYVVALWQ